MVGYDDSTFYDSLKYFNDEIRQKTLYMLEKKTMNILTCQKLWIKTTSINVTWLRSSTNMGFESWSFYLIVINFPLGSPVPTTNI